MIYIYIYIYIYMIIQVLILYYTQIYISIKECVNRSQFFTYNYGDFIVWSFETYGTQRWVTVVHVVKI